MSANDQWIGVVFPFVLAALLIAIGVGGSLLNPAKRHWFERWVFWPAAVAIWVTWGVVLIRQHNWSSLAFIPVPGAMALIAFYRVHKARQIERSRPSDTTRTGPSQ